MHWLISTGSNSSNQYGVERYRFHVTAVCHKLFCICIFKWVRFVYPLLFDIKTNEIFDISQSFILHNSASEMLLFFRSKINANFKPVFVYVISFKIFPGFFMLFDAYKTNGTRSSVHTNINALNPRAECFFFELFTMAGPKQPLLMPILHTGWRVCMIPAVSNIRH